MKVYKSGAGPIPAGAVFVGRHTPFGNPFHIGAHGTRAQVIAKYKEWVLAKPGMVAKIKAELRGKDLLCYCAPLACHADVLMEIANEVEL